MVQIHVLATFFLSFCSESQHELLVRWQLVMSLCPQFPVDPVTSDLEMIRVKHWMSVGSCTVTKWHSSAVGGLIIYFVILLNILDANGIAKEAIALKIK